MKMLDVFFFLTDKNIKSLKVSKENYRNVSQETAKNQYSWQVPFGSRQGRLLIAIDPKPLLGLCPDLTSYHNEGHK